GGGHEPDERRDRDGLWRQLDHQLVLRPAGGKGDSRAVGAGARGGLRSHRHVRGRDAGTPTSGARRHRQRLPGSGEGVANVFYEPSKGHPLPHDPFKALVSPRPIGWISTMSETGDVNLAPYSFFNALGTHPHLVWFSSEGDKDSSSF